MSEENKEKEPEIAPESEGEDDDDPKETPLVHVCTLI